MEAGDNVKPWVRELMPYVPGETREGYVKLASNENDFGPAPCVVEALKDSAREVFRYPYLDDAVKEAIGGYLGVGSESIIVGNGSDELIDLVVKTFRGPSCGVYPSFTEYGIVSRTLGTEYIEVPLSQDFSFPIQSFFKQSERANLIFLCTPNNPVGNVLSEDTLVEVLSLGKITVIDEAYYEFYGKTSVDLLADYKNLIVVRTFAKAFALAGLRAGYAVADPELVSLMSNTKPPFNVNLLAQKAVVSALDDTAYMRECVDKIRSERVRVADRLSERFTIFPSEANFILADVTPLKAREVFDALLAEEIIVRCFGKFKGFPGEYIRVTVGTPEENERLFEALNKI